MIRRRTLLSLPLVALLAAAPLFAAGGRASITPDELKQWLSYIASDELQGRAVYTEGLGLAAGYIQGHLQQWGLKPAGDRGSYLQTVRVLGVKATSRSSVTVQVGGETRTFKDGEGATFPRNQGAKRRLTIDRVEFAGYGLDAPGANYSDLKGRDFRQAAVIFIGQEGPRAVDADSARRLLGGRGRWLTEQMQAAASFTQAPPERASAESANDTPARGPNGLPRPDFTTAQRLDNVIPPNVMLSDDALQFVFSKAPAKYSDLRKKAESREALPGFRLDNVRITVNIDAEYAVVRTQLTQNIVAVVEGSDPALRATYVAIGAHYDHVGYAQGDMEADRRDRGAPGRVSDSAKTDRIWNGADDDGSGTVALMALARAFQEGPRPKRSVLFVWHAGEENGLLGSRYFADYPTIPLENVVAQLNIDMIGRNRDNKDSEADTVYLVGSDRISTELHEVNREANRALEKPLTLDYEMNDPADAEQLYFRSDHYSYAAKGIPVIFFTTGLHPDYHANTDEVSRIEFPKLARVSQLVYETAWRLGNLDHAPVRDRQGPRAGKGTR